MRPLVLALGAVLAAAASPAFAQWPPPPPRVCDFDGAPGVARLDERSVLYCGRITPAGLEMLDDIARTGDVRLHIASSGGELDAPLELAERVLREGQEVVVEGPCFSGCAAFVFVAGRTRHVARAGLLALHNTSSSAELLAHRLWRRPPEPFVLDDRAARERRLYLARGVSLSLLLEPQVRIGTLCASDGGPDPRTGERVVNLHSLKDLWAPSQAQWRAAGVHRHSSASQANETQAAQRLRVFAQGYLPVRLTVGGRRLAEAPDTALYRLGACP